MKVLHITPHLGGGVGSTILGYLSHNKTFEHEILSFGYTLDHVSEKIELLNIPYTDHVTHEEIINKIPEFDIVLIHQWNSPLLMDFLVRNELPPCRLVMLGHNSGFDAPNIYTKKILLYPDIFVFTTPLSYQCYDVRSITHLFSSSLGGALEIIGPKLYKNKLMYSIWSTDGVDEYKDIELDDHHEFVVGYIGTVDYAKLHPDFLEMCKGIIDVFPEANIKFVVVGGLKHYEIEAEADAMGIGDKFEFTGYVSKDSLKDYLKSFDVFGYPLASYHYGTCDLVLQIAMAAGVPPVVFNNAMEKLFIEHNKTGIVVENKEGYIKAITSLFIDVKYQRKLGKNARKDAIKRFTLENLDSEWEKVFNEVLKYPKRIRKWIIDKEEITAKDVFLESLGHYGNVFVSYCNAKSLSDRIFDTKRIIELAHIPSWQTETKGSVHNYDSYFPRDPYLSIWSELMKKEKLK